MSSSVSMFMYGFLSSSDMSKLLFKASIKSASLSESKTYSSLSDSEVNMSEIGLESSSDKGS